MKFVVADSMHEAGLRSLLRRVSVPGAVELGYEREPDFFASLRVMGESSQVIAALEGDDVVGMGIRSIRRVFVDGTAVDLGYLSGLRSLPRARGGSGLARGYAFLRSLHGDGRVPAYTTTVIDDNRYAREMLTSRRGGLPVYDDWGRVITHAVLLRRRPRRSEDGSTAVVDGEKLGLERLVPFVNDAARRRQFAVVWPEQGFGSGLTSGLSAGAFRALTDGNRIAAVALLWDQRSLRQVVVRGYGGALKMARPVMNAALGLRGYRALPPPGTALDDVYVSVWTADDHDIHSAAVLLQEVAAESADAGFSYMVVAFHERDPLRAAVRKLRSIMYVSRLYCVYWDDGAEWVSGVNRERIPHIDVALL